MITSLAVVGLLSSIVAISYLHIRSLYIQEQIDIIFKLKDDILMSYVKHANAIKELRMQLEELKHEVQSIDLDSRGDKDDGDWWKH